jgi:hypothetical protein
MNSNEKAFLVGLEKLSRETGVVVCGCGCCGSPFLNALETPESVDVAGYSADDDSLVSEIRWVSPADDYVWNEYKGRIASKP